MLLVDSSVWIDYFNGVANKQTNYLDSQLATTPILIGDLILTEVLQGFRQETEYKAAKQSLTNLSVVSLGGKEIALKAAENFRLLRSKGATIRKTIDCVIATFCIEQKIALLHKDRDFYPFVRFLGLRVPF